MIGLNFKLFILQNLDDKLNELHSRQLGSIRQVCKSFNCQKIHMFALNKNLDLVTILLKMYHFIDFRPISLIIASTNQLVIGANLSLRLQIQTLYYLKKQEVIIYNNYILNTCFSILFKSKLAK